MNSSLFIAQIFGILYLTVFIGFLLNKDHYDNMISEFMKSTPLLYLGGIISLTVGYTIVYIHNVWEAHWTVLITIIGWMALVKGVLLLISPSHMQKMANWWVQTKHLKMAITLILGLIFTYFGFFG